MNVSLASFYIRGPEHFGIRQAGDFLT